MSSSSSFSIPQAELLGMLLEGLAYGAYLYLFLQSVEIYWNKRDAMGRHTTARPIVFTALLLFVLINMRFVVDIARTYYAFTRLSGVAATNTYFGGDASWPAILRTGVFALIIVISEGFNVYRCFIIWDQRFLLCLAPFCFLLADIAIAAWSVQSLRLIPDAPGNRVFHTRATIAFNFFCAVSLAANFLCTCLILFKLWRTEHYAAPLRIERNTFLRRVMQAVIESSAIYSALLLVFLITDLLGSGVMFTMMYILPSCIGALFSQLFVRMSNQEHYNRNNASLIHSQTITIGALPGPGAGSRTGVRSNPNNGAQFELQFVSSASYEDDARGGATRGGLRPRLGSEADGSTSPSGLEESPKSDPHSPVSMSDRNLWSKRMSTTTYEDDEDEMPRR